MASDALTSSQRETLEVFDAEGSFHEPMTTTEVADRLDVSRRSAYGRLERMVEHGLLETKKVGSRGRVWWRPAEAEREPDESERGRGGDPRQFQTLVDAVEEYAIFRLDADGRVDSWNPGAERLKGYEADEILGESLSTFYPEDDVAAGIPERNLSTAAEQGSTKDEGWRVRKDGSRFWANVTISAIYDDDGELQGYAKVTRDMTERREYERQLERQARRLERQRDDLERELDDMFERIDDAFFALDDDWRITYVNEQAAELVRLPVADLLGACVWDALPEVADGTPREMAEHAMETQESTEFDFYSEMLGIWVEVRLYPSEDGLSVYFREVTERKERERTLEQYEQIFQTMDDGVYVVDSDGEFVLVNDAYCELIGYDESEVLGAHVSLVVDEETVADAADIERQLLANERTEAKLEANVQTASGEEVPAEANFSLLETDVGTYRIGVVRDLRERKERERELELYETLFEESRDVNAVVDDEGTFEYLTPSASKILGYEPGELVGENGFEYIHPDDREAAMTEFVRMVESPDYEPTVEFRFEHSDGSWIVLEAHARNLMADPDIEGIVVYTRDVTERREREHELERYETVVETVQDGIYAVDNDARFVMVNEAFCELTGYDREELLGAHATTIHDDQITPQAESMAAEIAAGDRDIARIELDIETKTGDAVPCESRLSPFPIGDHYGRCGVVRDVSDQIEHERELERRLRQQEFVSDLGHRALEGRDVDALMAEAAELVADALDNDYCKVLDLDRDADELLLRQGVGWDDGVVGEATVSAVENDSQAAYTLTSADPVVVEDLTTETRFSGPDLLRSHDVRSGISVVIGSHDEPWGILGTHDRSRKEFSEQDVHFVQSVANILATAITRHEDEQMLRRQREQLAALNSLNVVARDIMEAVIDQSTREEIERTVCHRLAETDSYLFAWIGDVDATSETVNVRAKAGTAGYLDGVTITVDPDDERSGGPTGRAFRTGDVQVSQDVRIDARHDPWREAIEQHGVRSSAAIPIVHDDTIYGVLNVYADRANAFQKQERTVITQLGEVAGHAISAVERKRALMSDDVVEISFRMPDLFETLDAPVETTGRITLDNVVPVGNGEFLLYGATTADATDSLSSITEALPHWDDLRFYSTGDPTGFELRLTDPPVLSTIASLGGYLDTAVIEDGDYRMTIHLPPSGYVREVIDVVQENYPAAEMLSRRQISRSLDDPRHARRLVATELTERQRAALEAAYHSGFFEWPRNTSGEEIAESLNVSPPTFHQHLRKAEKKVFDSLLSTEA